MSSGPVTLAPSLATDSSSLPSGTDSISTSPDEEVISEDSLRKMDYEQLLALCTKNDIQVPAEALKAEDVVDWLLSEFAV